MDPIQNFSVIEACSQNAFRDYWNEKLSDDEFIKRLDPSLVFKPTAAQLIVNFLIKKIKNEKLPRHPIKVANIYEINPDKLADDYGMLSTEIWYILTLRAKKYQNEKKNISTIHGYWKVKGDDETVEENGETVGFGTNFQFYKGKRTKTPWIMREFRVVDPLPQRYATSEGQNKMEDWVLCEIWNENSGWYHDEEEDEMLASSYNLRKRKHT